METGARPSELRRLTWNEVQENKFEIEKHKTVEKTGKPRVIYLTERLQRHIAQAQETVRVALRLRQQPRRALDRKRRPPASGPNQETMPLG